MNEGQQTDHDYHEHSLLLLSLQTLRPLAVIVDIT
jgi:hypothetical protein